MPDPDTPPPPDVRAMIRRVGEVARGERIDEMLTRMERDDQADSADSFHDTSSNGLTSTGESSSWFDFIDSTRASGRGLEDDKITLDQPGVSFAPDGSSESPSLSNPSPSVRGTTAPLPNLVTTPTYRPTRRPPMAVLQVYDDNQRDAEPVRIRQTPFVIGRQDGELVIGHERQMSRRHARIDRMQENDAWRWYLGDLRSTNGTFLCVAQTPLDDGTEVLVGGELVRFTESPTGGPPSLIKVAPSAEEQRVSLTGESHLIGTDASSCLPFLTASPYLDPHHYRVELKEGRWRIIDLGSTNALWVSITKRVALEDGTRFQIGEQRFSFHLP